LCRAKLIALEDRIESLKAENKQFNNDFEMWWEEEDNIFRNEEFKEQIKTIYSAGYKAGGHRPWYKINKEQLKVLMQTAKEENT
jgi:hypothetical protein